MDDAEVPHNRLMSGPRPECTRLRPCWIRQGFTRLHPPGLRRGFTTVELMIVIAVFAISAAVSLPFAARFQQSQTLGTLQEDVAHTLRQAQHRAVMGERDSAWGVKFQTGSYILYAGNSYADRVSSFDERHTTEATYTFSGLSEVTFRKIWGDVITGGTLMISDGSAGAKRIQVNSAGGISLQ